MPQFRRKPSRTPSTHVVGCLALAAWLAGGAGCTSPGVKDHPLDSLTESAVPYPTAVSASQAKKLPGDTVAARSAKITPAQSNSDAEPAAAAPKSTEIVNQPYKSTPLQLPEAPAKTIPLPAKNEVPPPLPLAPHQRPLNFPLAVAPPQAKPAANADAKSAPPNASGEQPSGRPTPPKLVNVAEEPAAPATSPAPMAEVAAPTLQAVAETTASYAPAPENALSQSVGVQPLLSQQQSASFPAAGVTPVTYESPAASPQPQSVAATSHLPIPSSSAYATTGYPLPRASSDTAAAAPENVASNEPTATPTTLAEQQTALIASLEAEIRQRREAKADQAEIARLELQLRLLYLLAERPDDAVAAIDALSPPERESCKHLLFGLAAFMADEPASRAPHRNAKVLRSLRDATSELAAGSRLDLRNMAFCEKVEYFGWYTEFPRYEFAPKQQVILYVEVENYAAESKGPQAFETELQGSYQIFDGSGQIIAERKLPLDREVCRNYRRDYFLGYRIYMPESIPAGSYRLELTLEDLKARGQFQGRKLGQGTIDFSIR